MGRRKRQVLVPASRATAGLGMGVARTGQGGEKPWDGHREQPKENPGAVVARRAGKMPMAVQHGGERGGMLGRLPSRPGIPPWCKGCGISCWRAATRCSALGISVLCFLSCYFRQAKKWVVSEKLPGSTRQACVGTVPSASWESRQRGRGTAMALARGCIASALSKDKRNCWANPARRE